MDSTDAAAAGTASAFAGLAATTPAPPTTAVRKPLDLPICSFRGPEVNLPWTERTELPVELQLEDVVHRLQSAQDERQKMEEEVGSGKYPFTLKTREKRPPAFAARAADAQKMLAVQKDPRFLELQAALRAEPAEPRGRQMHRGAQTARPNVMGSLDETKASWKLHFYGGLRMLIETVNMSLDPRMAEKQLDEAYRWYLASKQLGKDAARTERTERHLPMAALGPDFHDFCAEEVLRNPAQPGSAYYESAGEAIHEADPISSPSEKLEETNAVPGVKMVAGRPVVEARLASPKERLKEFSTKALVRPLTARKLKDPLQLG